LGVLVSNWVILEVVHKVLHFTSFRGAQLPLTLEGGKVHEADQTEKSKQKLAIENMIMNSSKKPDADELQSILLHGANTIIDRKKSVPRQFTMMMRPLRISSS
jgi:hypothetical protein